jgi:uncharacterized protein (DUF2235 family)
MNKNVVLCFDQIRRQPGTGDDTNATDLFGLLDESEQQIGWHHLGTPRRASRSDTLADARATVGEAYAFLTRMWEPDDRILVFGVGRGGYCAQALTRLLGTFGILLPEWDDLVDYVVEAYGLPRTDRTPREWMRVKQLAGGLNEGAEPEVNVAYLGLWDTLRPAVLPKPPSMPLSNVDAGRHAIALDGLNVGDPLVSVASDGVDEAWFRGGHCDVAGGAGACEPLAGIALDWILDGAVAAGAMVRTGGEVAAPTPSQTDALAGFAHSFSSRRVPVDARVHASVDVYLRAHPEYSRRLPDHVVWTDHDWLARGERLVPTATTPLAVRRELAAAAS